MIVFYIWPQAIVTEECPRWHPRLESYTCLCSSVQMSQTLDYLKWHKDTYILIPESDPEHHDNLH